MRLSPCAQDLRRRGNPYCLAVRDLAAPLRYVKPWPVSLNEQRIELLFELLLDSRKFENRPSGVGINAERAAERNIELQ